MNVKNWLRSSTDDNTISNTVRGVVTILAGTIVLIAPFFNVDVEAGTMLVDINGLAGALGIGAGSVWTAYGLLMKAVMWIGTE